MLRLRLKQQLLSYNTSADERGIDALLDLADTKGDGVITYRAFAKCLTDADWVLGRNPGRVREVRW